MTDAKLKWSCGECSALHDTETDARWCCQPVPTDVWVCGDCGQRYDEKQEADDCCSTRIDCPNCLRNHAEQSAQGAQIAIAGHCDVCNPIYTIEQNHAIRAALDDMGLDE